MHTLLADPRGRPLSRQIVISIFTHVVRTSVCTYVCMYVHVHPTLTKSSENHHRWDWGLTEWIIHDTCLVPYIFLAYFLWYYQATDCIKIEPQSRMKIMYVIKYCMKVNKWSYDRTILGKWSIFYFNLTTSLI